MFRGFVVGLVAGALTGLVRVQMWTVDVWVNSIGAWLLVPIVAGAVARDRAAAAGVLASLAQLGVFYAVVGLGSAVSVLFWCAAAVAGGATLGALSGRLRAGRRASRAAPRSPG